MVEVASLQQAAGWLGKDAVDASGALIGTIQEVVYDFETRVPVWLGMHDGFLGVRRLLGPVAAARPEGDHVRLDLAKDRIDGEPHVDLGQGFDSFTDEKDLYEYFGLPFDERGDVRVLRPGDELP